MFSRVVTLRHLLKNTLWKNWVKTGGKYMSNAPYDSNGKVCACGRHWGVGEWTPERRAANYKWQSQRMPHIMNENQIAYLKSWEKQHGIVLYRMDVVGKNDGSMNKRDKGKDVMGPVYVDPHAPMQMPMDVNPPVRPYRADIDS
jgi:hypothetical protein